VLLDPRQLLRWLNACRRDPERRVQFAYVDGKDKQPPVLAMSPKMSARKMYTSVQTETGVRTGAFGTAWVEDRSLMLKVDKPLGGLVKKVRGPVRAVGFRIAKVVLWREDGTIFEQDEDPADADAPAGAAAAAEAAAVDVETALPATSAAEPVAAEPAASGAAAGEAAAQTPSPEGTADFTARLKAALAALATAGAEVARPAKLLVSEAGALARQRQWAQADSTLRRAEALLAGAVPAAPAAPAASAASAGPAPSPGPATSPGRFVHQVKVRLGWQMARKKLAADLQALETSILAHYRKQPEYADLATRVRRFDAVLGTLDDQLAEKLDEALNAADPQQRSALHEQARAILAGYAKYVREEPLIVALDDNPFVPLSTHKTLLKTLQVLDNSLA
jgi:hypothetical protein